MMTDQESVELMESFRKRCKDAYEAAEKEKHEANMACRRAIKRSRAAFEALEAARRAMNEAREACDDCGRIKSYCRCS